MHTIAGASHASLLGLFICAIPAVAGLWYAFRPNERLLALMRPLTLAALFSALCSFSLDLVNGFAMASRTNLYELNGLQRIAAGLAEGMAPVAASFACLTVAWACIAIGMRRG
jgi:hypothetical protein